MPEFSNRRLSDLRKKESKSTIINQSSTVNLPAINVKQASELYVIHEHPSQIMPPSEPNLYTSMNSLQVSNLLSKVNMKNSFLKLATEDIDLINRMKYTIEYQMEVL